MDLIKKLFLLLFVASCGPGFKMKKEIPLLNKLEDSIVKAEGKSLRNRPETTREGQGGTLGNQSPAAKQNQESRSQLAVTKVTERWTKINVSYQKFLTDRKRVLLMYATLESGKSVKYRSEFSADRNTSPVTHEDISVGEMKCLEACQNMSVRIGDQELKLELLDDVVVYDVNKDNSISPPRILIEPSLEGPLGDSIGTWSRFRFLSWSWGEQKTGMSVTIVNMVGDELGSFGGESLGAWLDVFVTHRDFILPDSGHALVKSLRLISDGEMHLKDHEDNLIKISWVPQFEVRPPVQSPTPVGDFLKLRNAGEICSIYDGQAEPIRVLSNKSKMTLANSKMEREVEEENLEFFRGGVHAESPLLFSGRYHRSSQGQFEVETCLGPLRFKPENTFCSQAYFGLIAERTSETSCRLKRSSLSIFGNIYLNRETDGNLNLTMGIFGQHLMKAQHQGEGWYVGHLCGTKGMKVYFYLPPLSNECRVGVDWKPADE